MDAEEKVTTLKEVEDEEDEAEVERRRRRRAGGGEWKRWRSGVGGG